MIKLLFITDSHGKVNKPASRLDDFSDTILKKFDYVGVYAKENNVDAIIHGGDWVDSPNVSESFIRDLATILSEYNCPIYSVIGNHDIYGYNPDSFNRTPLGILEGAKLIKRLYRKDGVLIEKGDDRVNLTGQDSYFDLDKEGFLADYTLSHKEPSAVNIHVVHGMLDKKKWTICNSTSIDEIVDCNADIILSGHEHVGYGIIERNGKKFCNPGSLARVTSGVGDINRDVRMALITVEGGSSKIELINLPATIAKPASEVINYKAIKEQKENSKKLEEFMTKVNEIKIEECDDDNIFQALDKLIDKYYENNPEEAISEKCLKEDVKEISVNVLRKACEEYDNSNTK